MPDYSTEFERGVPPKRAALRLAPLRLGVVLTPRPARRFRCRAYDAGQPVERLAQRVLAAFAEGDSDELGRLMARHESVGGAA